MLCPSPAAGKHGPKATTAASRRQRYDALREWHRGVTRQSRTPYPLSRLSKAPLLGFSWTSCEGFRLSMPTSALQDADERREHTSPSATASRIDAPKGDSGGTCSTPGLSREQNGLTRNTTWRSIPGPTIPSTPSTVRPRIAPHHCRLARPYTPTHATGAPNRPGHKTAGRPPTAPTPGRPTTTVPHGLNDAALGAPAMRYDVSPARPEQGRPA